MMGNVLTSRIFPNENATGIETSTETGQVYLNSLNMNLRMSKNEKVIWDR